MIHAVIPADGPIRVFTFARDARSYSNVSDGEIIDLFIEAEYGDILYLVASRFGFGVYDIPPNIDVYTDPNDADHWAKLINGYFIPVVVE